MSESSDWGIILFGAREIERERLEVKGLGWATQSAAAVDLNILKGRQYNPWLHRENWGESEEGGNIQSKASIVSRMVII